MQEWKGVRPFSKIMGRQSRDVQKNKTRAGVGAARVCRTVRRGVESQVERFLEPQVPCRAFSSEQSLLRCLLSAKRPCNYVISRARKFGTLFRVVRLADPG
jgi:hypothetical protein